MPLTAEDENLLHRLDVYESIRQKTNLLPVKVSSFFKKKLKDEFLALGHHEGPLHRIVFPSSDRLKEAPQLEEDDHVQDRQHMPENHQFFLHKYPDRLLYMPLTECLSHCMYCFRQDILEEHHRKRVKLSIEEQVHQLISYIEHHPEIKEVILSGGDPMLLPPAQMDHIFSSIRTQTSVQHLRIHTKAIIFNPKSFSPNHLAVVRRHHVRVVLHVVHPYEWCTEVQNTAAHWTQEGVRLFNQFPLLRQINDHEDVLIELVEKLDHDGVRTLSIYFPDPVRYSSAFRIHSQRLLDICHRFQQRTPSWINGLRFSQDTVHGKMSLSDLHSIDPQKKMMVYRRGEQLVSVPDHPKEWDKAGELGQLLWKKKAQAESSGSSQNPPYKVD